MSDLGMFNTALEHHTLEVIVWQFDGTTKSAQAATAALQRELPLRDAVLTKSNLHGEMNTQRGRDGYMIVGITRITDDFDWSVRVREGQWLALWLHHSRLHDVEVLDRERGESLFRRLNPIVTLRPPQPGALEGGD